jgi:hypothetical protein
MATAQSIIESARYDLGDYQEGIVWDNAELLNYLNRMIEVMNGQLAVLDSELVEGEEVDIDCVADQKFVDLSNLNSGLWSNVKQVWIGQNLIEQVGLASMRYKRIYRTGQTAEPYYWTVREEQLLFEQDCAEAYTTLTIYYNKKQSSLAFGDSMPYQDRFNESFREMLSLYAQGKKDGNTSTMAQLMRNIFYKRAMEETIRREFVQKPYYIDF